MPFPDNIRGTETLSLLAMIMALRGTVRLKREGASISPSKLSALGASCSVSALSMKDISSFWLAMEASSAMAPANTSAKRANSIDERKKYHNSVKLGVQIYACISSSFSFSM